WDRSPRAPRRPEGGMKRRGRKHAAPPGSSSVARSTLPAPGIPRSGYRSGRKRTLSIREDCFDRAAADSAAPTRRRTLLCCAGAAGRPRQDSHRGRDGKRFRSLVADAGERVAVTAADSEEFAGFVATLGRGPGRSRSLTRAEARRALAMVLAGRIEEIQLGAFLMLLRYRGEDVEEIAGLVDAARAHAGLGAPAGAPPVDLDWPSYGAGRTRSLPWFLLAALALAASGRRVLMHGSNEFSSSVSVEAALAALGLAPSASRADVLADLAQRNFAYWPLAGLSPALERLLGM